MLVRTSSFVFASIWGTNYAKYDNTLICATLLKHVLYYMQQTCFLYFLPLIMMVFVYGNSHMVLHVLYSSTVFII